MSTRIPFKEKKIPRMLPKAQKSTVHNFLAPTYRTRISLKALKEFVKCLQRLKK